MAKMITRYISGGFAKASDVEAMATLERVATATMWEWYNHRADQDDAGLGGAVGNPSPMPARVVRPTESVRAGSSLEPDGVKEEDELDEDLSDMELSSPDIRATRDASPEIPLAQLSNTQLPKAESPSPSERSLRHSSAARLSVRVDLKIDEHDDTPRLRTPVQSRLQSPPLPVTPGGARDSEVSASPTRPVAGVFIELGSNKPPQLITLPAGFSVLDGPAFAAHAITSNYPATVNSAALVGRITSQAGVGAHRTKAPTGNRQKPYATTSNKASGGAEGTRRARPQAGEAGPSRPRVLQHSAEPPATEAVKQEDIDDDVVEVEKNSQGEWVPVKANNSASQARATEQAL